MKCLISLKEATAATTSGRKKQRVFLDFEKIEELSLAAALVLAAELDRWRKLHGIKLYPRNLKGWNSEVKLMLSELGFFDLLGGNVNAGSSSVSEINDVSVLQMTSSNLLDTRKIATIKTHLVKVAKILGQDPLIYGAMTEAAYNSILHAYPDNHNYQYRPLRNMWWATASWSIRGSEVRFLVYDQGVGIAETLPAWDHWEKIREFLSSFANPLSTLLKEHSNMIEAAVEVSRTSLTSGHGQGLCDILSPIDTLQAGSLRILSGKGQILYEYGKGIKKTENLEHLGGTLIEWRIPVGNSEPTYE